MFLIIINSYQKHRFVYVSLLSFAISANPMDTRVEIPKRANIGKDMITMGDLTAMIADITAMIPEIIDRFLGVMFSFFIIVYSIIKYRQGC